MTRTLILIPTASERDVLLPLLEPHLDPADRVELCGFGLVAAAALTSRLLEHLQPERVLLAGIAGTLVDRLPVGSAAVFREVVCCGIGAGTGSDHLSAEQMGWFQVGGRVLEAGSADDSIGDTISLECGSLPDDEGQPAASQLLSVTSASGSSAEAELRSQRYPDAAAEEMEGFGVGMACRLADTPLTIVRGISNRAGDRDIANWQIVEALESAARLATRLL